MTAPPPATRLVRELPATVPFVAPEALERSSGRRFNLRLGANESAFGASPRAREAMRGALEEIAWYGDPEAYALRSELARHHGVAMERIVVGSGIDDLLGLVVRAFLDRGEVAVTSLGAYPTFTYHVSGYGGVLKTVPYRAYHNDLEALAERARRDGARMVYLANPDNPTGTWHPAAAVASLLAALPQECLLVLDEAYADFAPADAGQDLPDGDPRVVRMRTFSKAHGLAGARIGYAIAARETVAALDKIRLHFGVNLVAQAGARAALGDAAFLGSVVAAVAEGRHDYAALAREVGLSSLPSAANFVAVDMGGAAHARAAVRLLLEHGVFVRTPAVAPLDRLVRVTVGTPAQRAAFAALFPTVVQTLRGQQATSPGAGGASRLE